MGNQDPCEAVPSKTDQILLSFLEKRGPSVFSAKAVYGEANTAEFEAKSLP